MSDNPSKIKMPFIGAQHSRSKIKQARNNNYTFHNCLNELIDYPILHLCTFKTPIFLKVFYFIS